MNADKNMSQLDLFSHSFICPGCGEELEASQEMFGRFSNCPSCGCRFLLSRKGEPLLVRSATISSEELEQESNPEQNQDIELQQERKAVGVKKIILTSLRWIGAALSPVPAAALARFLILVVFMSGASRFYDNPNDTWWYAVIKFICPFLEGMAMSMCPYYLAPSSKLLAASIITTVYATLTVISVIVWCFCCPFSLLKFIAFILPLFGMVVGIIGAHENSKSPH